MANWCHKAPDILVNIALEEDMSHNKYQVITWTGADLFTNGTLAMSLIEIRIKIKQFCIMRVQMSSAKWGKSEFSSDLHLLIELCLILGSVIPTFSSMFLTDVDICIFENVYSVPWALCDLSWRWNS